MVTTETSEIKRILKERRSSVKNSLIDVSIKGFKIHVVKAKREGYIQALDEIMSIIEFYENR